MSVVLVIITVVFVGAGALAILRRTRKGDVAKAVDKAGAGGVADPDQAETAQAHADAELTPEHEARYRQELDETQ